MFSGLKEQKRYTVTPVSDTKSVKPMVVIVVIASKTEVYVAGSHKSFDFFRIYNPRLYRSAKASPHTETP